MTVIWVGIAAPRCQARPGGTDRPEEGARRRDTRLVAVTGADPHDECLDGMFAALIEGRRPRSAAHDNRWTVAMLDGALLSAKRGEKVQLPG